MHPSTSSAARSTSSSTTTIRRRLARRPSRLLHARRRNPALPSQLVRLAALLLPLLCLVLLISALRRLPGLLVLGLCLRHAGVPAGACTTAPPVASLPTKRHAISGQARDLVPLLLMWVRHAAGRSGESNTPTHVYDSDERDTNDECIAPWTMALVPVCPVSVARQALQRVAARRQAPIKYVSVLAGLTQSVWSVGCRRALDGHVPAGRDGSKAWTRRQVWVNVSSRANRRSRAPCHVGHSSRTCTAHSHRDSKTPPEGRCWSAARAPPTASS